MSKKTSNTPYHSIPEYIHIHTFDLVAQLNVVNGLDISLFPDEKYKELRKHGITYWKVGRKVNGQAKYMLCMTVNPRQLCHKRKTQMYKDNLDEIWKQLELRLEGTPLEVILTKGYLDSVCFNLDFMYSDEETFNQKLKKIQRYQQADYEEYLEACGFKHTKEIIKHFFELDYEEAVLCIYDKKGRHLMNTRGSLNNPLPENSLRMDVLLDELEPFDELGMKEMKQDLAFYYEDTLEWMPNLSCQFLA